mgnify:CR=1 FL=1
MGQLLILKKLRCDDGDICNAALHGILVSKTETAWLSKFVREQGLRVNHRTYEQIDYAFMEHLRYYRTMCPNFPLIVAAQQSCMWSRQIFGKVSRFLREHFMRDIAYGEIRCVVDFCIDRRIAAPEKRLAALFIDLAGFLMKYVNARKTREDPWDACVSAVVRYHGERALQLKK